MNINFIVIWNYTKYAGTIFLLAIGAITTINLCISSLITNIPQLNKIRLNLLNYLAHKHNSKKFIKNAIAADIETHVNDTVCDLQKELPLSWIKLAKIKWVEDIKIDEINDGEMILRIRPIQNQDYNFLAGVYSFFSNALFPRTKDVIPQSVRKAAVLHITYRTICDKKTYLQKQFEDSFLESSIKEDPMVAAYLGKYKKLDDNGFFTGTFLREIHEVATRTRFHELRSKMNEEVDQMIKHMELFISQLNLQKGKTIPPKKWYRKGIATSYAFLLVARPEHAEADHYLSRAIQRSRQGIERLYVLGAKDQKKFAEQVISDIHSKTSYSLVETFDINKDYRGIKGGIGALFINYGNKTETTLSQTEQENSGS